MGASGETALCFAGYTLDRRRGCVRIGDREIDLRPKSFALLCYLVENAGRLLSKDDLIRVIWRKPVVTDESLSRCISDVRLALGDTEQRIIKTVPRRGYVFAAPVSHEAASSPVDAAGPTEQHLNIRVYPRTIGSTLTCRPVAAPRLSIVVLPFANLSEDGTEDYFVEAITESLTTDLSRIHGSFVIGHNTALTYRRRAVDVRRIGRELGVRYVMHGSVQYGAERVRVNTQLVDAETGALLWGERFDRPRADVFDLQDEITAELSRWIGLELIAAEGRRTEQKKPKDLDSMDVSLRGWALWNRRRSLLLARQARGVFETALRGDDRNLYALIGLGETLTYELLSHTGDRSVVIPAAMAAVSKALELAPNNALAHYGLARVLEVSQASEEALREYEVAIRLDRNLADAHSRLGLVKSHLGRAEETEAHVAAAMRLGPREPILAALWWFNCGFADLHLGRLDLAVHRLKRAVEINSRFDCLHFFLAAAQALAGHDAEAAETCAIGRCVTPSFSISRYRGEPRSDNPVFLAGRDLVIEGMRAAGVPE